MLNYHFLLSSLANLHLMVVTVVNKPFAITLHWLGLSMLDVIKSWEIYLNSKLLLHAKNIYTDDCNMSMYRNNYSDDCDTQIEMPMTVLGGAANNVRQFLHILSNAIHH